MALNVAAQRVSSGISRLDFRAIIRNKAARKSSREIPLGRYLYIMERVIVN